MGWYLSGSRRFLVDRLSGTHYAKKLLELNLKTFLKPSDVKTCLEKHWKVFSRFIWIYSESFTSIRIQVGSLSENALINRQPSDFALTRISESVFHLNGKDLNTLGKVVTSENALNNVIWKCSGVDLEYLNTIWTQYIWLSTNRNIWLPSDSV